MTGWNRALASFAWEALNGGNMRDLERIKDLPDHVVVAMREVLAAALEEARQREPPADGSLHTLNGLDRTLGNPGADDTWWSLQPVLVADERFFKGARAVVHAYPAGVGTTRGWVAAPIVHSPEDRRRLDEERLEWLIAERGRLDERIGDLRAKLGIA